MESTKSEAERTVLCKHLDVKAFFTAILRLYSPIHREMRESLLLKTEGRINRGISPAKKAQAKPLRKIMTMGMLTILVKAKPDIDSITGLNLTAVRHTTVQVTRVPS
jgi:hypothetical protein